MPRARRVARLLCVDLGQGTPRGLPGSRASAAASASRATPGCATRSPSSRSRARATAYGSIATRVRAQVEAALRNPYAPRVIRQKLDRIQPDVTREDSRTAIRPSSRSTAAASGCGCSRISSRPRATRSRSACAASHPTGRYTIANKAVDPAWSAPDKPWAGAYRNEVVAGGSAENPLKARWLGIVDGVGIHGTDATWSLGTRASHGCIRMAVPDVKALYERVPVGALVMIK